MPSVELRVQRGRRAARVRSDRAARARWRDRALDLLRVVAWAPPLLPLGEGLTLEESPG